MLIDKGPDKTLTHLIDQLRHLLIPLQVVEEAIEAEGIIPESIVLHNIAPTIHDRCAIEHGSHPGDRSAILARIGVEETVSSHLE